jgi:hypothetical protein
MKNLLCFSIVFSTTLCSFGQNDTAITKKLQPQLATIKAMNGNTQKGWLLQAADDTVFLLAAKHKPMQIGGYYKPDKSAIKIHTPVPQISTIRTHKKNAVLRGTLIGLASGAFIGAIAGYASGDDPVQPYTGDLADVFIAVGNAFAMTAEEKAVASATGLGLAGAGIGAIIGAVAKKKFIIGGNKQTYKERQHELMVRSMVQ